MNISRKFLKYVSSLERFPWMAVLACMLSFLWTVPVDAWPIIYVNAPSALTTGHVSQSSIALIWEDNAYNEDGFQIEIATTESGFEYLAKVPADTTSYVCSGLNENTQYRFRVKALGNAQILLDSDYSNVASAKTMSIPKTQTCLKAPGDLVAVGASKSSIKIRWKDNNLNESGYGIERKTDNGAFAFITQVPANFVSYTDLSVSEGFTYTYRVIAIGDGTYTLDSDYSNEATAAAGSKASGIIKAPSGLAALAVSSTRISLTWIDHSINESGYSIERAASNGNFEIITTLPANTTTYIDQGLQDNTKYTYRVRALGACDNSPYSNEASAVTGKEEPARPVVLKFYIGNNIYYVNDQIKTMDTTPIVLEDRTLLPISYAASFLGVAVYWDDSERKVTLNRKGNVIEMWIDQSIARINGVDIYIDPGNLNVAPRVFENRTMLPLAFVVSNLNCRVEWFTSNQEVRITYPVPTNKQTRL